MRLRHRHFACTAVLLLSIIGLGFALRADEGPQAQPPMPPNELMREAIVNEIEHPKSSRFCIWMDRVEKPKGSWTRQMVGTPEGIIARLLAVNDKPLTPEQRKTDDDRLNRLLDPAKMGQKTSQQRADEQRSQKLLRALPAAFDYTYSGSEIGPAGHHIVRLNFSPASGFAPPNFETQIYLAMKGQVWIDTEVMRVAKIDGTLFKDLNLGWGFIGKLNKGGRLVLVQGDVGNGHWDTTRLELKFTGKVLLLKHLQLDETETEWDFHPVPKMSVKQAIELLRGGQLASTLSEGR